MTQVEQVLEYIRKNGSITQLQALNDLGVMRLASRVSDLRRLGYPVVAQTVKVETRSGKGAYVKQYRMVSDEG